MEQPTVFKINWKYTYTVYIYYFWHFVILNIKVENNYIKTIDSKVFATFEHGGINGITNKKMEILPQEKYDYIISMCLIV